MTNCRKFLRRHQKAASGQWLKRVSPKRNPFFLFFFLLAIPFAVYFVRPDFVGNDAYAFLLFTCKNKAEIELPWLQFPLFSLLPCNFVALKAALFACAFVSGCFIIKLSTLFSPKNGWRAAYLLFLGSAFVLDFAKLENDAFAFPFLFASLYFFFKAYKTGKRRPGLVSIALLFAAALFWQGAFFYIIAYALNISILLIALSPLFVIPFTGNYLHWRNLVGLIWRTNKIAEDMPFQFHVPFILTLGIAGLMNAPLLLPQGLFFFALGVASAKFWILSFPFLIVGFVLLLEQFDSEWLFQATAVLAIVLVFGLAQSLWLNPPRAEHWEAIDYALSLDNNVVNDWGLGWWIKWKGGTTGSYASFLHQEEFSEGRIGITEQDTNCSILREFEKVKVVKC